MDPKCAISIVIPARNEEETVGLVVRDCKAVCGQHGIEHEVIVVDDGSQDGTKEIAAKAGAVVIENTGRHGKGLALRLGFKNARHNTIVMLDADYSHRAEDIPKLLDEFKRGYGIIIANRFIGGSDEYSTMRAFGNYFLTLVFCQLFGFHLNDSINGYKVLDKRIVTSFDYVAEDFSIEVELMANARALGLSVGQVPSHERARQGGKAKSFVFKHGFSFLSRILKEYAIKERKAGSIRQGRVKKA